MNQNTEIDFSEYYDTPLNQLALPVKYQKSVNIIIAEINDAATVKDLININPMTLAALPNIDKEYVKNLIELQKLLPDYFDEQRKNTEYFKENYIIDFNKIDNILSKDIARYLRKLDRTKIDIAASRWGFNHQRETLQNIANRHNLTRERIRQIEKAINDNLPLYLTIQPKALWANIREKMTEDLTILLPNLAKCFVTDDSLYAFIELCCQIEAGSIRNIMTPKMSKAILNPIFCTNRSPVAQEFIINELMSNYGYSKAAAIHVIKRLHKLGHINITGQGVYPKNLSQVEAVAHVLMYHPEGLPWKDIARIINAKRYSARHINEKKEIYAFYSKYVYLCGSGKIRHISFLDIEQFDIPEIMLHLISYFNNNKTRVLYLNDYYYETDGKRSAIDYFTLRHILREYGAEYGLYFKGKSNADTLSLNADFKNITQADVIENVLNKSEDAMTIQEIALHLRSKSTNHAQFYIKNLVDEGKIAKIDDILFTTPERAFKNVNTKAIMQIIEGIMNTKKVLVEADIFRECVNLELNLSYSKHFYISLIKTNLKTLNWYNNNTLFSKKPISFKNLLDMCKKICDPEKSNIENVNIIKKRVLITNAVAHGAVQQWRHAINNYV
jgi:hypothetical protein